MRRISLLFHHFHLEFFVFCLSQFAKLDQIQPNYLKHVSICSLLFDPSETRFRGSWVINVIRKSWIPLRPFYQAYFLSSWVVNNAYFRRCGPCHDVIETRYVGYHAFFFIFLNQFFLTIEPSIVIKEHLALACSAKEIECRRAERLGSHGEASDLKFFWVNAQMVELGAKWSDLESAIVWARDNGWAFFHKETVHLLGMRAKDCHYLPWVVVDLEDFARIRTNDLNSKSTNYFLQ